MSDVGLGCVKRDGAQIAEKSIPSDAPSGSISEVAACASLALSRAKDAF
jgi:hypothetical protein